MMWNKFLICLNGAIPSWKYSNWIDSCVHLCHKQVICEFYGLIWCKIFIESFRFDSLQWLQSAMINKKAAAISKISNQVFLLNKKNEQDEQ